MITQSDHTHTLSFELTQQSLQSSEPASDASPRAMAQHPSDSQSHNQAMDSQDKRDLELPPILSPLPVHDHSHGHGHGPGRAHSSLPPLDIDISRPPSTSSQTSSHYVQSRPSPRFSLQLPGLSQLSGLASASSPSPDSPAMSAVGHVPFRFNLSPQTMGSTAVATVGLGGQLPVCQNCATSTTPMWRRDENGTVLCNACGLFLKLHGRPRPISLKTDTIKSRNRARLPGDALGLRKKGNESPVSSEAGPSSGKPVKRARLSQQTAAAALHRSQSLLHRGEPTGNIAPQSMFDTVTLASPHSITSANLTLSDTFNRPASPARAEDTSQSTLQDGQMTYDQLLEKATGMQTRINELDVINVLFRGRVEELEVSQQDAREKESAARTAERAALADVKAAQAREAVLKDRIEELERLLNTRK